MVRAVQTVPGRITALLTLALAGVVLLGLPGLIDAASYLGVLAGTVVLLALVAAARLWWGGHLEGRVLAASLALLVFAGQMLNLLLGLPGARHLSGPPGATGTATLVLEGLILVMVVVDCRRGCTDPGARQPYALGP